MLQACSVPVAARWTSSAAPRTASTPSQAAMLFTKGRPALVAASPLLNSCWSRLTGTTARGSFAAAAAAASFSVMAAAKSTGTVKW